MQREKRGSVSKVRRKMHKARREMCQGGKETEKVCGKIRGRRNTGQEKGRSVY